MNYTCIRLSRSDRSKERLNVDIRLSITRPGPSRQGCSSAAGVASNGGTPVGGSLASHKSYDMTMHGGTRARLENWIGALVKKIGKFEAVHQVSANESRSLLRSAWHCVPMRCNATTSRLSQAHISFALNRKMQGQAVRKLSWDVVILTHCRQPDRCFLGGDGPTIAFSFFFFLPFKQTSSHRFLPTLV